MATRTVLALAACAIAASVVAQSDLPDCTCKNNWYHDEQKCGRGNTKGMLMKACPTVEQLGDCEWDPKQSWCETDQVACKQQDGTEMVNKSWSYCDAETNKPSLPFCVCSSKWTHNEGSCTRGGATMYGCPSHAQISQCEEEATDQIMYGNMTWCETTHTKCQEQVDHYWWDPELKQDVAVDMEGDGWAYCDTDSGRAELPDCVCEDEWVPDETCQASDTVFEGCISMDKYLDTCKAMPTQRLHNQNFCKTKITPCKQQSESNSATSAPDFVADMYGGKWSYCSDEKTWEPEYPQCRCKASWKNDDADCEDAPLAMSGCPTVGTLRKCDSDVQYDEEYCHTTYKECDEQGYEMENDDGSGGGWAYCDSKTQESLPPICMCESSWDWTDASGVSETCKKAHMRGCPTLEEIKMCEPEAVKGDTWCNTKDMWCREQSHADDSLGKGWVYCDPITQYAQEAAAPSSVGAAIGITFVLTVMFCATLFIGFLYAYKQYLNHHKKGYSQELLQS